MKKVPFIIILLLLIVSVYAPTRKVLSYIPKKKIYFPQHAIESAKVLYIKYKLKEYVKHPAYQKKGRHTYCNVFARDVLDYRSKEIKKYCFFFNDFYYDVSPVFPRKNNIYMSIRKAYYKAIIAQTKGLIKVLTAEKAQEQANKGKLIWGISRKYNHEFIVFPGEWSETEGCWVAQAGDKNGIFRISAPEVFRSNWQDKEIRFYEFREIGE